MHVVTSQDRVLLSVSAYWNPKIVISEGKSTRIEPNTSQLQRYRYSALLDVWRYWTSGWWNSRRSLRSRSFAATAALKQILQYTWQTKQKENIRWNVGFPRFRQAALGFLLIILFVCLRSTKLSWFYVITCYQGTVFAWRGPGRSQRHARTRSPLWRRLEWKVRHDAADTIRNAAFCSILS
jgi:hypothetical protein